jgi:hypothetical protein
MIDDDLFCPVFERLIDIVQPMTRSDVNGHWLPSSAATGICRAGIRMRPFVVRAVGSLARPDNGETQPPTYPPTVEDMQALVERLSATGR